jgi:ATP-binding cassette subfamily F protein 2
MPSDNKKKKEQQKKEARKKKDLKKPKQQENGENDENEDLDNENDEQNGEENGVNGDSVPTQASDFLRPNESANSLINLGDMDALSKRMNAMDLLEKQNSDNRACTGVLASHPNARDIHIHQFSLTFYGQEVLVDAKLELNHGRRYGIIGLNGSIEINGT